MSTTNKVLPAFARALAPIVHDFVRKTVQPIIEANRELQGRVAELESKALFDAGAWRRGQHYQKNSLVSYHGLIWIAQQPTAAQPGHDHSWRLAHKSGHEGNAP